ncbi:MAG: hypothetical protein K5650_04135 [Bacteroidales bacterium]|nr:hypothetical protein [Bacteroidales bacterium]
MKNIFSKLALAALLFTSVSGVAVARECTTCKKSTSPAVLRTKASATLCKRAQSTAELNVNNVRALINGYGNMWYDGSVAQYHLPKSSNTSPLFCAALWIGGTDVNNQLRLAALRFGSSGDDYWPGPLELTTAAVDLRVCNEYDKHWVITKAEVQALMKHFQYDSNGVTKLTDVGEDLTATIEKWPWQGGTLQSKYLAPFYDANNNGKYEPSEGDYPYYDFDNALCPRTLKASLGKGEHYVVQHTMEETKQPGVITNSQKSDQVLKGDQTIWWIFNDMGNTHTETHGQPIGLEIRAQAFAFSTNDAINDMTFYSYEIINRSTYELRETYFSQWVDPDLGYAFDDYVGCDVKRGLGYCYNGDDNDGPGSGSYSGIPPAVGIDFFQGPYMDPDGKDNPKIDLPYIQGSNNTQLKELLEKYRLDDGAGYDTISITDDADLFYALDANSWYCPKNHHEPGDEIGWCAINGVNFGNNIIDDERFGMRRFVYYDNSNNSINGEPSKAKDYYYYLRGFWKNGSRMKFGGDGATQATTSLDCDFMFPGETNGTTDPWNWGTSGADPAENGFTGDAWTEKNAGNTPGDRRFMQSAGPFTLRPGAVNYITVGIPYAQASSGNAWSSVESLRQIDDICQALFDNCFKVLDGPDAPTLVAQELDKEIILYITYDNKASNNFKNGVMESYAEFDPSIPSSYVDTAGNPQPYTDEQRSYKFEGYQIYQLADANASVADIEKGDLSRARLVAQCDIENYYDTVNNTMPIDRLVNFTVNSATGLIEPKVMVNGSNSGIRHVFRITTDQFASGTSVNLVNNKEYYFVAIAYAQNRFKEYSQTEPAYFDGQKEPYLAGRKNENSGTIEPIVVVPHNPIVENGGTQIQAEFGMNPRITRISGYGNSGRNVLRLRQSVIDSLMGPAGQPGKPAGVFAPNVDINVRPNLDRSKINSACMILEPEFEENNGPINVTVIDPLNVKPGKFIVRFWNDGVDAFGGNDTNMFTKGVNDSTRWCIESADGGPIYYRDSNGVQLPVYKEWADFCIGRYNEQLFLNLGISVALANPTPVASALDNANKNITYPFYGGITNSNVLLASSMTYADENLQWLVGVADDDNDPTNNWIRSGQQYAVGTIDAFMGTDGPVSYTEAYLDEDYFKAQPDSRGSQYPPISSGVDPSQQFEGVVSGLWSPYGLVSTKPYHPGFNFSYYIPDQDVLDSINALRVRRGTDTYTADQLRRGLMDNMRNKSLMFNDLSKLPSVRIVFTADTSKWTRCPVLEMCEDNTQSEGNARRFHMREHKSVNKLGKTIDEMRQMSGIKSSDTMGINDPRYIAEKGMGWFPGYAISVATGERLNIMFGEDSRYVQYNGRDMMWNPVINTLEGVDNYVMGGRHYIYVMNSTAQKFYNLHSTSSTVSQINYRTPSYDAGKWAAKMLSSLDRLMTHKDTTAVGNFVSRGVVNTLKNSRLVIPVRDSVELLFASCAWVNMPIVNSRYMFKYPGNIASLNEGEDYFGNKWYNGIACDVTVDIDVNMPYNLYISGNEARVSDIKPATNREMNWNMPMYQFEMTGSDITLTQRAAAQDAEQAYRDSLLALINVVPNPYYSYSTYETSSQLETKVRIVNLPTGFNEQGRPAGCEISIYTVDGTMVRKFPTVDINQTTYDWDLHNHNGIPIAGGMYFIHVRVPGIGERVIKWFGTMRPVDLNSYQF